MINKSRKAKLDELQKNKNNIVSTGIPLRYKGQTVQENVWKIPLDILVYNKYNGRIGTSVMSYEKQNGNLDIEQEKDYKLIEKFLWDSKEDKNKKTMDSLQKNHQQRHGIVTADGVIIDGNRRAMLLNKLFRDRKSYGFSYSDVEHCKYFNAIILPNNAEEKDIQQLETIYQMGEDDKLDYNPIEKYLKCKELKRLGYSEEDIANFMNEKVSQIKKRLKILDLMESYLQTYDYEGIYTRLEKTEGPFVDLEGYLDSYERHGANVSGVNWVYEDTDINNLKIVSFDYIRARYEGKDFRNIGKTGKEGSIFFHEDLWNDFLKEHNEKIEEDVLTVQETREKYPGEDLSVLLKARDEEWIDNNYNKLKGNLQKNTRKLEDKREANKPGDLIERALSALQMVDLEQPSILEDIYIEDMVKEINDICWEIKKMFDRNKKK